MKTFVDSYRVNFYDCDPAGIIFFANLFKIAHSSYEKFLETIQPEKNYFNDTELVIPIISSSSKFIKPLKAGDKLVLELNVSNLGDTSFVLTYKFLKHKLLMAEAETVHVFVDKRNFKKVDIPEIFRENISDYLIQ